MSTYTQRLAVATRIVRGGYVITDDTYTLSAGGETNIYVDLRQLSATPLDFTGIAANLREHIAELDYDFITATGAAIPISSVVAAYAMKPFTWIRSERKEHGSRNLIEGFVQEGARALVIDDVLTTGKSIQRICDVLTQAGMIPTHVVAIVDRRIPENRKPIVGMDVTSLCWLSDIEEIMG